MKPLYIRKETNKGLRKVMLDMAFIATNKKIRLPKYFLEDGFYLPYYPDKKDKSKVEKLFLTMEKVKNEDENFYYFDFPLKAEQVEDIAA